MATQHPAITAAISARILARMQRDRLNVFQAIDAVLGPGTSDRLIDDVFNTARERAMKETCHDHA